MIQKLIDIIFGCGHLRNNFSFPQSVKPGTKLTKEIQQTGKYVVCLDCGKELAYDWNKMEIVGR